MRDNKLVVALDFDDTLCECISIAIELVNQELGSALSFEDIDAWNFKHQTKAEQECLHRIFDQPDFYSRQKPMPGAVEMVEALIEMGHEPVILSAPRLPLMGLRAKQIQQFFPMIAPENVLLGSRKDLVHADILLDDALHNIKTTGAKHPIIFRRPWNSKQKGSLSVSNYKEFLLLVDRIADMPPLRHKQVDQPYMVCLVGPSGSGKTAIAGKLLQSPAFGAPRTTTTRRRRPQESDSAYNFVSTAEFMRRREAKAFLEETCYAGNYYGTEREEVHKVWNSGKHIVFALDINGAPAMKSLYGNRAVLAFVCRSKEDILDAVVSRNIPVKEKVSRIISLEREFANEKICDMTVINRTTVKDAAQQIIDYLQ